MTAQQISEIEGIEDQKVAKILREMKTVIEQMSGRGTTKFPQPLAAGANNSGVINRLNYLLATLQGEGYKTLVANETGTGNNVRSDDAELLRAILTNPSIAGTGGNLYSSSYTPTITNGTNVAASTSYAESNFTRDGDYVHGWIVIDIDPTAAGAFDLEFTPPIASAFASSRQAQGNGVSGIGATSINIGRVIANTATGNLQLAGFVADTGNLAWRVSFRYLIV